MLTKEDVLENGKRLIALKRLNYQLGLDENKRFTDRKIGRTKMCYSLNAGGWVLLLDCISIAESKGRFVYSFSLSRVCGGGGRDEEGDGWTGAEHENKWISYLRNVGEKAKNASRRMDSEGPF